MTCLQFKQTKGDVVHGKNHAIITITISTHLFIQKKSFKINIPGGQKKRNPSFRSHSS